MLTSTCAETAAPGHCRRTSSQVDLYLAAFRGHPVPAVPLQAQPAVCAQPAPRPMAVGEPAGAEHLGHRQGRAAGPAAGRVHVFAAADGLLDALQPDVAVPSLHQLAALAHQPITLYAALLDGVPDALLEVMPRQVVVLLLLQVPEHLRGRELLVQLLAPLLALLLPHGLNLDLRDEGLGEEREGVQGGGLDVLLPRLHLLRLVPLDLPEQLGLVGPLLVAAAHDLVPLLVQRTLNSGPPDLLLLLGALCLMLQALHVAVHGLFLHVVLHLLQGHGRRLRVARGPRSPRVARRAEPAGGARQHRTDVQLAASAAAALPVPVAMGRGGGLRQRALTAARLHGETPPRQGKHEQGWLAQWAGEA
mmetsp:Transcript_125780/g.367600  ORF Transcript_125780/g.367600 Transcript_125780/m.367600 type:complete len:362 (+) Transcript_125780:32-1117(+)